MVAPPLLDVQSYFFLIFIRFSLDYGSCDDFSKLAHPSQTLYCQSSRMVQLTLFVQPFFPETLRILVYSEFPEGWILIV